MNSVAAGLCRGTAVALLSLSAVAAPRPVPVKPADAKSGRDYLEACHGFISMRPDPTGTLQHQCVELIQSSAEYEQSLQRACIPGNETTRQVIKAVVDYLDTHPELLDRDMTALTSAALKVKFPCSKGI